MICDPNWLYSTLAQSSAAIVAIIGGFITATVLMLTAEKRSLVTQVSDKRGMSESLQSTNNDMVMPNILALESEIPILEARIKAFSYPPNLKMGACVLGFLAVFGIIMPVIIIANEAFHNWAKWLTTGLFCLGITGVFAYIIFLIRTLRRQFNATG
ncbi:hypothetical protein ACFLVB_04420 [Chloroflexota bacterium]